MLSGDKASDNKGDQVGTLSWPQSVARTLVLNQLEKLPRGGLRIDEPDGNTVMLDVPLTVVREGDAVAKVAGQLVIDVADFGYAPGIEKLREIAGLKSISTEVPVNVKLVFVHETS